MGKPSFLRKNNFWKKNSDSEVKKTIFLDTGAPVENFRKILEKSQIGPGRSGRLRKPPQTYFLGFRRSLRSKWGIYQPRTTISDHFLILWSSSIIVWIPRNRDFVDLRICDIAEGKLHTPGKLFFGQLFFLELFIWSLSWWNFGF